MTMTAQPLYPHTVGLPPTDPDNPPAVNVDALCDAYERSGSGVMYINAHLSDTEAQALFDAHELVAEFDEVRGVDAIRHATDDEIAAATAAKEQAAATKTTTTKTTTSSSSSA
jgi:alkanesulfonate monooxygenase SsuD/methylene tetrahydromethanopterin reductase-like flavin-dependent oxidoreductase (luciferase family)